MTINTYTIRGLQSTFDCDKEIPVVFFRLDEENGDYHYCTATMIDGEWVPATMEQTDQLLEALKKRDAESARDDYNYLIGKINGGASREIFCEITE